MEMKWSLGEADKLTAADRTKEMTRISINMRYELRQITKGTSFLQTRIQRHVFNIMKYNECI